MNLSQLTEIAIQAALAAGKVIQKHLNEDVVVERKEGGTSVASQVVTAVDRACEAAIFSHLLPTCKEFGLALLSEETADDGSRFAADYFWCIDPMDGTLAFIHQRPGFSVSIALVARDGTPCIGVVYDPSTDTLYHAARGKGAFNNGHPWEVAPVHRHFTYVTDRKLEDTPRAGEIKQMLHARVAEMNLTGIQAMDGAGAVLNAILVLENGPACMVKLPKKESGGGSIWDFAATACIYKELGLSATNFAGGKLDLNKEKDTFMNHEGVFFANF